MNCDVTNIMRLLYLFYFFSLSIVCFVAGYSSQWLTTSAVICQAGETTEPMGAHGKHEGEWLNSISIVQLAAS